MVVRRIYYTTIFILTSTVLILNFFIPTPLAQELSKTEKEQIKKIITTFASEPKLGMELLEDLAKENPELAVLAVVQLVKETPKLAVLEPPITTPEVVVMTVKDLSRTQPEVAVRSLIRIAEIKAALHAMLTESVVLMIEDTPDVAAVAVQSIKQVAPENGRLVEEDAVAAGLERSYLLAASPIMP